MLVTRIKPAEEFDGLLPKSIFVVYCLGCREVFFPLKEAREKVEGLRGSGIEVTGEEIADYLCRGKFAERRLKLYSGEISKADGVLVFSCGVGVQVVAEKITDVKDIPVFTACDTVRLAGFAGLTPSELDCVMCGQCVIGLTSGICPVANCPKGLVNGPCGGAMDGRCEISPEKDCVWIVIYDRLKRQGRLKLLEKIKPFRDHTASERGVKF
ncbi:MAG: methylenetetrahydrofolate reductase C-terminal domain-containing protein [Deltaproteobacteria bacterium]|uniref:Methylenetetrahydrofolate reductase C-terminal domain-containing protein n=1 Tax=Candidatus Zymogenus saltonus TaxID=2844893 RepID=A0A9D8PMY7_9DELT|nr:methylenetetrahydrofolate reductase C-terminal domain-containing protein [Candidatus Zymogenus saltonus]